MSGLGLGLGLMHCGLGLGLDEKFFGPRPRPRPHSFWPRPWPWLNAQLASLTSPLRCPLGCGTTYYFGVRITITGRSTLVGHILGHTRTCPLSIFSTVFARGQKLCGFWLPVYRSKLLSLLCSLQTHVKSKNCSSLLTSPTLRLRTIVLDLAWCVTIYAG